MNGPTVGDVTPNIKMLDLRPDMPGYQDFIAAYLLWESSQRTLGSIAL